MRKMLRNWLLTECVRAEKKAKDNAASTPKHTVLSMAGLTSAVWTLGMFEMVSGESCQCIHRTKQKNPCDVAVRHAACTVPTCGFVVRYQNTSNLEQHYIRGGHDHAELADRLAAMQQLERQEKLASGADGRMVLSRTFNAPAFTAEKKALCDMKFVKWLVRKSRALTMGRQDDELNEFIEQVTDGAYTLPCYEVILKLVKQMQAWGDTRIKKIVQVLAAEGIKISIAADIWYSYALNSACSILLQYTMNNTLTISSVSGGRTVFLCWESRVMQSYKSTASMSCLRCCWVQLRSEM